MDAREQYDAAVSWSKRQVSYLETWLRSIEKQISETAQGDARYWSLLDEKRALSRDLNRVNDQRREVDAGLGMLAQERTMIRKAKRRAERRLRIA